MRILILTKYGRLAASSRYRFLQFLPALEKDGIHSDVSPLLSDEYLEQKFRTGRVNIRFALEALFRRVKVLIQSARYDAVLLYSEAYPYAPGLLVWLLRRRGIPYIYDYDDAVFHTYDHHELWPVRFFLGNKIRKIIAGAFCVFAGNRYLAEYAREAGGVVEIVPTVVDLRRYASTKVHRIEPDELTIGWIGSPSTAQYLELIQKPLAEFCRKRRARVVLVGSGPIELRDVPLEMRDWSEETEVEDLLEFDVGIMPLPDSGWARGKCGFKLIQYMACGLPVIASPVGANLDIVTDGVEGLLAGTSEQWLNSLERLAASSELRESMGAAGRARVERSFCTTAVLSTISRQIRQAGRSAMPALEQNIDWTVVKGFGSEWQRFDQSTLSDRELDEMFAYYFRIFPWQDLPEHAVGFDLGCGSGRWALRVAPRVGELHCIDPSREALQVAKRNLREYSNCRFHLAGVGEIPLPDSGADFGYSLGVLHHLPDPMLGLKACVSKLKPGAPFLLYLYYAMENRPLWYRWMWRASEPIRFILSRSPQLLRYLATQGIAALVYWPLARMAKLAERFGLRVSNLPLSAYRERSFYVMRNDALDRFGTRLEKRFTRREMEAMMSRAGLERITFSETSYWCAVGYRKR